MNLAARYRPQSLEDVVEQKEIKDIIEYSLKNECFKNISLFVGSAGTGKTTTARIVAKILDPNANIIEIDAASNNGVENIRNIIDDSKSMPLVGTKKIYILDECHQLSKGAFDALLKLLEEPPKYFYILFCTTDPQKVPGTILSRVQRYDFKRISQKGITERLKYITEMERVDASEDVLDYIAKIAEGGMRTAISLLDKALDYSKELNSDNIVKALGMSKYDQQFKLLNIILNEDKKEALQFISSIYDQGEELKRFISSFVVFLIDINKALIYFPSCSIPISYKSKISQYEDATEEIRYILKELLRLDYEVKYCQYVKPLMEATIIEIINKLEEE